MISPTVGRKIWYRPSATDLKNGMSGNFDEPLDATVVRVIDFNHVGLAVLDQAAKLWHLPAVQILNEKEDYEEGTSYAEWMPYQIEQANKTDNKGETGAMSESTSQAYIAGMTFGEALKAMKLGAKVSRGLDLSNGHYLMIAECGEKILFCKKDKVLHSDASIFVSSMLANDWVRVG